MNNVHAAKLNPTVICEFETEINLVIPAHLRNKILREVNKFHIGKEDVPLDEEWPEGKHGPMTDVHWNLAVTRLTTVTVQVLSDGNLKLKTPA